MQPVVAVDRREINKLYEDANRDPRSLSKGIRLIDALLADKDIGSEELNDARTELAGRLAPPQNFFDQWISETMDRDVHTKRAIYQMAVEVYPGASMWGKYMEFLVKLPRERIVIESLDRGIEETKYWISGASDIWRRWFANEIEYLKSLPFETEEWKMQVQRIMSKTRDQLSIPHSHNRETFQMLSQLITSIANERHEQIMSDMAPLYLEADRATGYRDQWEIRLANNSDIQAFEDYIAWEKSRPSKYTKPEFVFALYERALDKYPYDVILWDDYLLYVFETNRDAYDALLIRALKFAPKNGVINAHKFRWQPFEDNVANFPLAVGYFTDSDNEVDGYLEWQTATLAVLEEGVRWGNDVRGGAQVDDKRLTMYNRIADYSVNAILAYGAEYAEQDSTFAIEKLLVHLCTFTCGDTVKARDVWKKASRIHQHKALFWTAWLEWEGRHGTFEDVQKYALAGIPETQDWPEAVADAFLMYSYKYGTKEQVYKALVAVRQKMKDVEKRRRQKDLEEREELDKKKAQEKQQDEQKRLEQSLEMLERDERQLKLVGQVILEKPQERLTLEQWQVVQRQAEPLLRLIDELEKRALEQPVVGSERATQVVRRLRLFKRQVEDVQSGFADLSDANISNSDLKRDREEAYSDGSPETKKLRAGMTDGHTVLQTERRDQSGSRQSGQYPQPQQLQQQLQEQHLEPQRLKQQGQQKQQQLQPLHLSKEAPRQAQTPLPTQQPNQMPERVGLVEENQYHVSSQKAQGQIATIQPVVHVKEELDLPEISARKDQPIAQNTQRASPSNIAGGANTSSVGAELDASVTNNSENVNHGTEPIAPDELYSVLVKSHRPSLSNAALRMLFPKLASSRISGPFAVVYFATPQDARDALRLNGINGLKVTTNAKAVLWVLRMNPRISERDVAKDYIAKIGHVLEIWPAKKPKQLFFFCQMASHEEAELAVSHFANSSEIKVKIARARPEEVRTAPDVEEVVGGEVYIGGLKEDCRRDDLESLLLNNCGPLRTLSNVMVRNGRGFAFADFAADAGFQNCLALNGAFYDGQNLIVSKYRSEMGGRHINKKSSRAFVPPSVRKKGKAPKK